MSFISAYGRVTERAIGVVGGSLRLYTNTDGPQSPGGGIPSSREQPTLGVVDDLLCHVRGMGTGRHPIVHVGVNSVRQPERVQGSSLEWSEVVVDVLGTSFSGLFRVPLEEVGRVVQAAFWIGRGRSGLLAIYTGGGWPINQRFGL